MEGDKWNAGGKPPAPHEEYVGGGVGGLPLTGDLSPAEEEEAILDYRTRSKWLFICLVTTVLIAIAYTSVILTHDPGEL